MQKPEGYIRVVVIGDGTEKPGVYYLKDGLGVKELVSADIGTYRLTSWRNASLIRDVENHEVRIVIDLEKIRESSDINYKLENGDILFLHRILL